ncbi:MAG: ABC transporter permease subunit [Chloroflexota bacterium]
MRAIFRKEMADYFNSIRFVVFFILVFLAAAAALFAAYQGIRGANPPRGFVFLSLFTTSGQSLPSLAFFLSILIPLIGIALGFDAINSERAGGTLSRIMSQPIYRDNVINGKFLAGLTTMIIMVATTIMLVGGYGLRMIGVPPSANEIIRLFIFFVLTMAYGTFWLGLAILFSITMRKVATSLLMVLAVWLFFSFFMLLIAPSIANAMAPVSQASSQVELVRNAEIQQTVSLFSPTTLYSRATAALLMPVAVGTLGVITPAQVSMMLPNPLNLTQSLVLVWPYLTSLISLSVICFGVSYIIFMRQEIRAT